MSLRYYTSADGLKLAYRDEGAGLPLIALAGLTRNARDFDFVAPHLAGVRLIRPDYRGRGASQRAPWQSYSVATEAGDVLALMDHLGLERAAFLGTSRGGLIAMALAMAAKARLIGVCLNDIGPVIEPRGLANIELYLGRTPVAKTWAEAVPGRAKTAVGFKNVPPERWLADVKNLFDEGPEGLSLNYDPALRAAFLATGDLPDLWPMYDALAGLPLALIQGAGSDILGQATVDEMRRRRPDLRLARLEDRGHVPWLDEPEALAVIHAWLKDCGA